MAFKSLINNQIKNAFNLIGDLGEKITFTNQTATEYNYETGTVGGTISRSVEYDCIVKKQYKESNDNPRLLTELEIQTDDVSGDTLSVYDTVVFRNKDWSIVSVSDSGFIVSITIAKGGN